MDPQAQLNLLTEQLRVIQETNAQLVQFIANQHASVDDETKFYKRLATHSLRPTMVLQIQLSLKIGSMKLRKFLRW